jgi:hypothetical protein
MKDKQVAFARDILASKSFETEALDNEDGW